MAPLRCIPVIACRHELFVACVAAVMLAFSATQAEASCGDWLVGHAGVDQTAGASDHEAAAAHESVVADLESPAGNRRPPCNGPACSQRPDLPITPAGPVDLFSPSSRDLAALPGTDGLGDEASSWLVVDDPSLWISSVESRIERPPARG